MGNIPYKFRSKDHKHVLYKTIKKNFKKLSLPNYKQLPWEVGIINWAPCIPWTSCPEARISWGMEGDCCPDNRGFTELPEWFATLLGVLHGTSGPAHPFVVVLLEPATENLGFYEAKVQECTARKRKINTVRSTKKNQSR